MSNSVDEEFFSKYGTSNKKTEGIPGFQMNRPLNVNSLTGSIGLELEIEADPGSRLPREGHLEAIVGPDTKARWRATTDGSLRGEALEYVLSSPCSEKELVPLLDGLFKVFQDTKTVLNNSNRCSTHVHINVGGKKVNQITSAIALWSTFEDLLIGWCGEERVCNHFALSTKDATSLLGTWEDFLRAGRTGWSGGLKYSALNILPIWERGSIEFRTGPAANDPVTPRLWATFLYRMCSYAFTRFTNPMEIAYALSERGGWDMFSDICGESLQEFRDAVQSRTEGVEDFNRICMAGFRNAQSIVLGYPWDQWLPLIDREFIPNPFDKKVGKKTRPLNINFLPPIVEPVTREWEREFDEAVPQPAHHLDEQQEPGPEAPTREGLVDRVRREQIARNGALAEEIRVLQARARIEERAQQFRREVGDRQWFDPVTNQWRVN